MSRTLKWVLGILAVLFVIVVVAGGIWIWQNRAQMMASVRPYAVQPNAPSAPNAPNNAPNGPNGPFGFRGGKQRFPGGGFGFRMPMMGGRFGRGMPFGMGFFFLGGLFRLIIPLGLLALVAILFYQLGRRSIAPRPSAPAVREPAPSEPSSSGPDAPKSD